MIDIEKYLRDKPGHPLNRKAAECVRLVFSELNDTFTTERSRVDSVSVDEGSRCLSILFTTPYLCVSPWDKEAFANILRLADSAAVSPKAEDDGFSALIVLTFVVWD